MLWPSLPMHNFIRLVNRYGVPLKFGQRLARVLADHVRIEKNIQIIDDPDWASTDLVEMSLHDVPPQWASDTGFPSGILTQASPVGY